MKKKQTTIHIEFKEGFLQPTTENKEGKHFYFGSISSIFETFSCERVGVKQKRLYDFNIEEGKPYTNKICTIRKGTISRKAGGRTAPVKILRLDAGF